LQFYQKTHKNKVFYFNCRNKFCKATAKIIGDLSEDFEIFIIKSHTISHEASEEKKNVE